MSTPLESLVEELFIRAIEESAGLSGIYTPDLHAKHYAEDGDAKLNALSVEAMEGDQMDEGPCLYKVDVVIRLRTLSTVPVADEEAAWAAIESITKFMGPAADFTALCPITAAWALTTFYGPIFRYSKTKVERPPGNNMRHRERHLPIETRERS